MEGKSTILKPNFGVKEQKPDGGEIAYQNYKIGALKQYFDFYWKTLLKRDSFSFRGEEMII